MKFGRFVVLSGPGVGGDAGPLRARDEGSGEEVRLTRLPAAGDDAARALVKRVRLAAALSHPTALRVAGHSLEGDGRYVAVEASEPRPSALSNDDVIALAEGIAEAHRLGLTHGRLRPDAVRTTPGGGPPRLDWTEPPPDAATRAGDVAAFAALIAARPESRRAGPGLYDLLDEMRCDEHDDRPPAAVVADRLRACLGGGTPEDDGGSAEDSFPGLGFGDEEEPVARAGTPERLGRYVLREPLGGGAGGVVYRAEDSADGTPVAVKAFGDAWAKRPDSVRRLTREAGLMVKARSPYVVRLVDVGEDSGVHYLVLEYVPGVSLARRLSERGRLDEASALRVAADAARGLAVAHAKGVVHRDVTPHNLLLVEPRGGDGDGDGPSPVVKITDFELALAIDDPETDAAAFVGTPLYMAPEQAGGTGAGFEADVYALGATLFHTLAGRPPFQGDSALALIAMHRDDPPPRLRSLVPGLSEGVCAVVARALAKRPEDRYADAGEMLDDLEHLLRGESLGGDGGAARAVSFEWRFGLESPPERVWPFVADFDRFDRAVGLPAVDGPVRQSLRVRERPAEWVEGLRTCRGWECARGPFRRVVSGVELTRRPDGGTTLVHRVVVEPRGVFGRVSARVLVGLRLARTLRAVYGRIDAAAAGGRQGGRSFDPYEPPARLPKAARGRLDRWLGSLVGRGVDPAAVDRIGDFLASESAAGLARVRPAALARRLGIDAATALNACLIGAKDGVFTRHWDVECRGCGRRVETADARRGVVCPVCGARTEADRAAGAEIVFRSAPEFRPPDLRTFAGDSPARSPRTVARVRVGPGRRSRVGLGLGPGSYAVSGVGPSPITFRVDPAATARRLDLTPDGPAPPVLAPGGQTLGLWNDTPRDWVVTVDRSAAEADGDALTADSLSASGLFRDLFPGELLPTGRPRRVPDVTFLVTEPDRPGLVFRDVGEAKAFALFDEHLRVLDARVRGHGGTPVKVVNGGVLAAFPDPAAAVRAAFALGPALHENPLTRGLRLRVGVHRGAATSGTLGGRPDYFGAAVNVATALPKRAACGGVVVTPAVAADPAVAREFRGRYTVAEEFLI